MIMYGEDWTKSSRLALGPLASVRARLCPRRLHWVYTTLVIWLTSISYILVYIFIFGWWCISIIYTCLYLKVYYCGISGTQGAGCSCCETRTPFTILVLRCSGARLRGRGRARRGESFVMASSWRLIARGGGRTDHSQSQLRWHPSRSTVGSRCTAASICKPPPHLRSRVT